MVTIVKDLHAYRNSLFETQLFHSEIQLDERWAQLHKFNEIINELVYVDIF